MNNIKDRYFVVTGANRGIGRSIVESIAETGGNVYACMRKTDEDTLKWINSISHKYSATISPIVLDLSSEDDIKRASKEILSKKTSIDGIVNNAGITGPISMFSMMKMVDIRKTFEVNFFGPSFFTQRLIKCMIKNRNGSIVNVSSIAALDGEPAQFAYVASKAAINGATKKLANELAPFGIRVNAVCPGMVDTEMSEEIQKQLEDRILNTTAMGRKGKTTEIADVIRFLLSDDSSFITGQIIRVDGGRI